MTQIDLSKLTPAPWFITVFATVKESDKVTPDTFIVSEDDTWIAQMDQPECENDAAFIALARNAFDVMMRHPEWQIMWIGEWCVVSLADVLTREMDNKYMKAVQQICNNPFSAFVAADEWVKENIEKPQ